MIDTETWKVGIYCRLSREDELEDESKSITNQREMCMNYCVKNGLRIIDEYIDDGISGSTDNRPSFKRMLKDIDDKKINMVAIDRDDSNWVEYLTKLKLNERFDYIFKTDSYGSINLTDSKMKILGLLDNVSKRFYTNDTWYMDRHLPEIKYISLYDVTRLMREDVKKAYNKYIYDNIGDFKSMGYKAYKEYMSYSENVAHLNSKAQERYISNFKLDKIEFSFYNKYYGNSDDGIADTQTILQYI